MYNFVKSGNESVPVFKSFILAHMPHLSESCVKVYLYILASPGEKDIESVAEELFITSEEVLSSLEMLVSRGLMSRRGDVFKFLAPKEEEKKSPLFTEKKYLDTLSALMGGRQFSASEIDILIDLKEVFRLPEQVVYMLVEHTAAPGVKGNRVSVRYIEKAALAWAEEDIRTVKKAKEKIDRYLSASSGALRVINKLYGGNSRLPNAAEKELYDKWTAEWGFTQDAVLAAVRDASLIAEPSMKYLDAILRGYYERGVRTVSGICRAREERQLEKERMAEVLTVLNVRRSVSPALEAAYSEWTGLGFSHASILRACEYTVKSGYHSYKKVGELLQFCADKGVTSDSDVARQLSFRSKEDMFIHQVMSVAGLTGSVTDADRNFCAYASEDLKMPQELILFAADMSSIKKDPRSYMRKLVDLWAKEGIDTLAKAKRRSSVPVKKAAGGYIQREPRSEDISLYMKDAEEFDG